MQKGLVQKQGALSRDIVRITSPMNLWESCNRFQGGNKISSNAGVFFDKNIDFYDKASPIRYDYYFLDFIKTKQNQDSNLLDICGGSGTFAKLVVDGCPSINVTVLDPSEKSLSRIDDTRIRKVNGELPNRIPLDSKFDYVHVKEVFHHITGSSVRNSKELLRRSLFAIKEYLNDDGFLLINELFYESYLIPSLSRALIFHLLTLQNKLRIKIPVREFIMDLETCFYSRSEFRSMLGDCGFRIVDYHEEKWADNFRKKAMFLKCWGSMLFILKKAN